MPEDSGKTIPQQTGAASTSPRLSSPLLPLQPIRDVQDESSDEEVRRFILKYDGFNRNTAASSSTPRVKFKKTPRIINAPKCKHIYKKGSKRGEVCGVYCKLGDDYCGRHKSDKQRPPKSTFGLENIAVKVKFNRLKVSKRYRLVQNLQSNVILENNGRILKVRLPIKLKPVPKIGSFLKFQKIGQGMRPRVKWECT